VGLKLPCLEHDQINAGIGHQRRSVLEAVDVPNLAQNRVPFRLPNLHADLKQLGVRIVINIRR
jgi:hypothetical protein